MSDENFTRHWNGQLEQRLAPHDRNEDFYNNRLREVRAEGGEEAPVLKELRRVRRERGFCLSQWLADVQAAQDALPKPEASKKTRRL